MPLPVIGGIIAAAGSVGGAAIASHSANKAAEQQTAASDKALAVQQQQYANAQKLLSPYLTGGSALSPLNYRVNPYGAASPFQGVEGAPTFGNLATYAGSGQTPAAAAANPGGGDMVMMQAPASEGGMRRAVPRALVPHYQQKGAQVV